jgi:Tfp pilus assembly protein PilF
MRRRNKTEVRKTLASLQDPTAVHPRPWASLALCALAFGLYAPSLFSGFVRDDYSQIVNNPQVQSWSYLPRLLTSHLWSHAGGEGSILFYRPLFSIWMLLVHSFGGLSPLVWHLSSILLNVGTTYLVFRVCMQLLKNEIAAALAAALFVVHPTHVDAVSWISASNELLFVIFSLGSILVLIAGSEGGALTRSRLLASTALYVGGLFAKETTVAILPFVVILAWVGFPEEEGWRPRLKNVLRIGSWYVGATVVYFIIRLSAMRRVGIEVGKHSWREVLYTSPSIAIFYLKKLILPTGLSGCYVNPLSSSPTMGMWLTVAAILVGAALVVWLAVRYSPMLGVAAALIVLPILPCLAGIRVYDQGDMTHDRYLYLPSLGLALLLGLFAKWAWSGSRIMKTAAMIMGVAWVGVLFSLTVVQQRFYKNDQAFYQRMLDINPSHALAYSFVGNMYLDEGRTEAAVEQFRRAHQLAPEDGKITLFLARGLVQAQQFSEAEVLLQELLQTPNLDSRRKTASLLSLANVETSLGKVAQAEPLLQQVEDRDSSFPGLHWARGVAYERTGRIAEAQAEYFKEFQITGDRQAQKQAILLGRVLLSSPSTRNSRPRPD